MKVRCVQYFNAYGDPVKEHGSLIIGREYEVFGILIGAADDRMYHLLSSYREPVLPHLAFHPAKAFEIVDAAVPSSWSIKILDNGSISLAPSTWQSPGYLEALYDGDSAALYLFEQEKERVLSGSNGH